MLNPITNERELAYIAEITDIKQIDGYDRICLYYVNGWSVVSSKGAFNIGDKCVFIEPDSLCPYTDTFKFLDEHIDELTGRKTADRHKIKVQKFCKGAAISAGLILTLDEAGITDVSKVSVGDFLTKSLNITYWEAEDNQRKANNSKYASMQARHKRFFKSKFGKWLMKYKLGRKICFAIFGKKKDKKTDWPSWVIKTDEERCLPGSAKVLTDHGVIRIDKLVNQKLPYKVATRTADNKLIYENIVDYQKYTNNTKPVCTIRFQSKPTVSRLSSLCCTIDHKVLTANRGYVEAQYLTDTDKVLIPATVYSEDVLPVVYGMLLGDSHIAFDRRNKSDTARVVATNGEKQLDYLRYKKSLFDDAEYDSGKITNAGLGTFGKVPSYHWSLKTDYFISTNVLADWYATGSKKVTKAVCDKLTPISLAFWYLDDGTLRNRNGNTASPRIELCTHGFTRSEVELLQDTLLTKFNLKATITEEKSRQVDGRVYYALNLSVNSTKTFLKLVAKYIPKSMQYKVTEDLVDQLETEVPHFKKHSVFMPVPVREVLFGQHKNKCWSKSFRTVYDIEVANTHNFIADGIVVHNCQNNFNQMHQLNIGWIRTEKIDGTSTTFTMRQAKPKKRHMLVCSRNVVFDTPDKDLRNYYRDTDGNVYLEMATKYNLSRILNAILDDHPEYEFITIQGETYGGTIQKRNYGKEHRLAVFNVIYKETGKAPVRLNPEAMYDFLHKYPYETCVVPANISDKQESNNDITVEFIENKYLETVPILDTANEFYRLPDTCDELLTAAGGPSQVDGGMREGIVLRSLDGQYSFKAVDNQFLCKYHN